MVEAYRRGFIAKKFGAQKNKNPYSPVIDPVDYYAWLGGWNDNDMGYRMELKNLKSHLTSKKQVEIKGYADNISFVGSNH